MSSKIEGDDIQHFLKRYSVSEEREEDLSEGTKSRLLYSTTVWTKYSPDVDRFDALVFGLSCSFTDKSRLCSDFSDVAICNIAHALRVNI